MSELQLDDMTVTEVLRLFILGVGGRSGGTQYNGKWRFNHRGMYSDMDSPCLEMRQKVPKENDLEMRSDSYFHSRFYRISGFLLTNFLIFQPPFRRKV